MLNTLRKAAAVILALAVCCCAAAASAETMHREVENPEIEIAAELGYNGVITYGKAMPLRVRIRNWGADLEGTLGINAYGIDSREYSRYETAVSVPAGAEKEYVLPFSVMSRQKTFTAEITVNGRVVRAVNLTPSAVLNPSAMMIGVLSTRPRMFANMNITPENDTLYRYEYWQTVELTADTFPDRIELLESFGMLVIDDIDPAQLTDRQRETLEQWIGEGHILLCGGGAYAARNVSYFSGRTGLSAGDTETSDGVLPALETLVGATPSGKSPTVAVARIAGGNPLAADAEGRGLLYRAETGVSVIYTMAFEAGESALNSESVMHWFWQQLLVKQDAERYNSILNPPYGTERATVYPGYQMTIAVRSPLPVSAAVIAGVLVLGSAAWLLLKKRDKRQWMWLIMPLLAIAGTAVILLLGGSSDMNRPMAVYAENILQEADGTARRYIGLSAGAPQAGLHSYSLEGVPLTVQYNASVWIDEEEEISEPTRLSACYTVGDEQKIAVNSLEPWTVSNFSSTAAADLGGQVDAEIWMEKDGLHGRIGNRTALSLKPGKVITGFGYVSVPALKSGESADFALLEETGTNDEEAQDGKMYRTSSWSLYSMSYFAFGLHDNQWEGGGAAMELHNLSAAMLDQLGGDGNGYYGSGNVTEKSLFLYVAEPENRQPLVITADGNPIRSATGSTLLGAEMKYLKTGRTGIVFHTPGMDKAVRLELDNGMPAGEMAADPNGGYRLYYHSLSETPTFRFDLDRPSEVEITALSVILESWYVNDAKCFCLNAGTGEWEEVPINKNIDHPERYLDAEGRLYCQFRPNTHESYAEINTPGIQLEGRTRNADH